MANLTQLFEEHQGRTVCKWVHYLEHYERHLGKFVGKELSILEIGVEAGGSLQLWKKYFGNNCQIVGVDINEECKYEEDQIKVEIGSQTDLNFLQRVVNEYGPFDIIIDDGSHMQKDIRTTFEFLYPHLKNSGVYIVEDLHCAYMPPFQGGIVSKFNFISFLSSHLHDVNRRYIGEFFYSPAIKNLKSVCFYDSMVFLEKEEETERCVKAIGNGTTKVYKPTDIF